MLLETPAEIGPIIEGLRAFVRSEVVVRHEKHAERLADPRELYTAQGLYSPWVLDLIREVRMSSAAAGYYTMFVPEAIGGAGLGNEVLYRVWEDLHHHFGLHYWLGTFAIAHWSKGPSHVLEHATPEVRADVLPGLLSGEDSMCFAMSEPDAGSDARRMRTRAELDGDDWIINGSKIWITNGPYAEHAVVFAVTDPVEARKRGGISAFLVPTDAPGFVTEPSIRMFGAAGGDEAVIHLDNVRVKPTKVLGTVGRGFDIALSGVRAGRVYNSARAVGLARWAIERAVEYAGQREAFGRPISANQGVMFPLAEAAMEIRAAHLLGLDTAMMLDQGHRALKELSMAKAFSTEAAFRALDACMQTHGALGFTNEMGLAEAWHATRKARVADGTAEILRRTISAQLLKGDLEL